MIPKIKAKALIFFKISKYLISTFLILIQIFIPLISVLTVNTKQAIAAPPANFVNETLIINLNEPTSIAFLPNGKMLILERAGIIHLVENGASVVNPTPFLNLSSVTNTEQGERGLTGIAIDPHFHSNNYIYLFYTRNSPLRDRVSRFVVQGDTANPDTETVIWEDNQPAPLWHHGGSIAFGNDGKLYISLGDGFDSSSVQSLTSYRGKMLRINKDGSIPNDNPFYDGAGPNLDAIWALGLRNPFRFQVDPLTGRIYIGDVGGNNVSYSYEEINLGVAGANYGWPICEGNERSPNGGACTPPAQPGTYQNPIHSYPHGGYDASVTGGFVYRNGNFPPPYKDSYFYGDYVRNWIKGLTIDPNTGLKTGEFNFEPENGSDNGPYGEIVDLKQGPDGAIYYVDIGISWERSSRPGTVRRIKYLSTNQPPIIQSVQASVTSGGAPLNVNFSVSATDNENEPLSYSWNFGDGSPLSTEQNPSHVYEQNGQYTVRVTVSDGTNQTISDSIIIKVGTPPIIETFNITSPSDTPGGNITFRAGDIIQYNATASDPDGVLTAQSFEWRVILLHLSHSHPEAGPINAMSGTFQIPTTGHEINDEIQFRFILKVTDSDGLTAEQAMDIYPETVNLILQSSPVGLTLNVDGINKTTPYTLNTVINFQHQINAPNSQTLNGTNYNFVNWSNSQNQNQINITVPSYDQAYTANYGTTNIGITPLYGYSLDENTGTIAQSSFTPNNLNLVNGPTWITNARYNGGLSFDGVNDRASGGSFTLPSTFTFMAWVYNPSNNPYETLISVGPNRDLYLDSGRISFYDGTNERNFGNAISTNTWHHIALVSTGTQIRAYFNGNQIGTNFSVNLSSYSGNLHLGAWPYNNNFTDFLSGSLDDVRIYNTALTQEEIQTAMNSAVGQTQLPANFPPSTQDQTVNVIKNNTTTFSLNASENENEPLSYHIVTNAKNGSLNLNQNQITYTPNSNFTGSDSFAFRVNDGTYFSNTSIVTINVLDLPIGGYAIKFNGNGINDIDRIKIPVDNPETPVDVGQNDFTIEWWMKANDSDNSAGNCISSSDGWINGNIIIDRDVYGNGDYGDFGISLFNNGIAFGLNNGTTGAGLCGNTKVDDGNWHHIAVTRSADTGEMKLFVNGILDAQINGPTGNISYRNGRSTDYPNDRFLVLGAEKHDAGPQYPSYNGEIDELRISNNIRYTTNFTRPSSPFNSDSNTLALYHFDEGEGTTVYDSNQNGTTTNGQIFYGGNPAGPIYVVSSVPFNSSNNPNSPPVANDDTAETNEDTQITIPVLDNDTDPDGGILTVINVSNMAGGIAYINPNYTVRFVPDLNFNGMAQFTYTISDGQGGFDTANVTIIVNPVNDPPNAQNDTASTFKNIPIVIDVLANDTDVENETLSIVNVTNPLNGEVIINQDNTITYTPNNSYVGVDSFEYVITDGNNGFGTATVGITVNDINQPPVANNDNASLEEDTQAVINVLANDFDPDNDPLSVSILQQPLNGTAVVVSTQIVYTPSANYNGTDSLIYQISDGKNGFASASVSLTILPVNDLPIANNQSFTTQQNTSVNITLSATDVDNDTLTFNVVNLPTNGSLTGSAPNLIYTPNNNFSGGDSFTFMANDGIANSNTATITITVLPNYNPYSLSFDGNDFARFTDIPLSQQYTYEAWIFRNQDTGTYETFLSDANSSYSQAMFTLYIDGGSQDCTGAPDQFAYYQTASNNVQCSGTTIQVGQWYHLAVTRDSTGTRRMFVNGSLVSTQTNAPNATNSSGRVNLGRAGDNNSEYFRGMIDAVRISNIARYTSSFTPPTSNYPVLPNTIALYYLDSGTGQTLIDSSGNNRNGTRGASTSVEVSDPSWVNQSPIVSN